MTKWAILEGDIHTDLHYNMGQATKDYIKGLIQKAASQSGIIVLLNSREIESSTILQKTADIHPPQTGISVHFF